MPYNSNDDLPSRIKDSLPSDKGRTLFREVFNRQMEAGRSETVAFASAWGALQDAGYEQNSDGKWVKKESPSASDVHVPNTGRKKPKKAADFKVGDRVEWNNAGGKAQGVITRIVTDGDVPGIDGDVRVTGSEDDPAAQIQILDDDGERTDTTVGHKLSALSRMAKAETFKLPKGARDNARKVLRWREEHGDEVKGMTEVGWRRARQLANNETVGAETVKAMAQFNRHRKNAEVADEHKGEPWKDAGYVAWLGWGGDVGIDWAIRQSERMKKAQVNIDVFTEQRAAEVRASELGLSGSHVHEIDGQAYYMPGQSHEDYLAAYGASNDSQEKTLFERAISAILNFVMSKDSTYGHKVYSVRTGLLKIDEEQRIAWGWASVISENGEPVVDKQGDIISADVMTRAANAFMSDVRAGQVMHEGVTKAVVLHSLPLSKDLAEALELGTNREGWIIGMKVKDEDTWERVKSGELRAFSIGGEAMRSAIQAE